MSIISRIRSIFADSPEPELIELEDKPGIQCRWIEITVRCRSPINEGENMPSGCDARCPARVAMERRAEELEQENSERFYF